MSQLQECSSSDGTRKLRVTILADEWQSSKVGLSTMNKELAIQLAQFSNVEVTVFLLKCTAKDKREAHRHDISLLKAEKRPGYNMLDCLSFPPDDLSIDVVVGHGSHLGRQGQIIRNSHKCKWIQVVHSDPEELGMLKHSLNGISEGERKHNIEVKLCQMADFVVGVGPKLTEAFRNCLAFYKKDVFEFTPGLFKDFSSVAQAFDERSYCSVLIFGRGDRGDFMSKGFDIAAKSVADLPDSRLFFVGVRKKKQKEILDYLIKFGFSTQQLRVKCYENGRDFLKKLFCQVDLLLMPSRTEEFGLTGLEALSAGLPVIVSKKSGFGEALSSVNCGSLFVIDSEDPIVWTAAIKEMWEKGRQLRLNEVERVRSSYDEKYSWSKQCKALIEKMIKLVDGTSSEPEITTQAVGAETEQGDLDDEGHSPGSPSNRTR
ncbi:PREDICTED: uncharacterized protein LOC107328002 isoform X3 [Acropora digitifera]|uniref:uncharacterized protein LOC107328002 isoform X3 n=1 Tax=Acropora digitifera TaxID=70779 RepID=UPI00077AF948|nr:PREDICTED: uncharacterized protein LOC107328002 isoform X3 [Acropora digitifera]XP_015748203.1 PREDICTED: uncharacterized protein LOC107328002 isoform X3 [Acropora digitifera]